MKLVYFFCLTLIACSLLFAPLLSMAAVPPPPTTSPLPGPPSMGGTPIPPATMGGDPSKIPNPLGNINSIYQLVELILEKIVLPIGSVIVVFFLIYSGFLFVTAGGSEEKLSSAKKTFLWTVVGAAVLLGSVVIAKVIETTICGLTTNIPGCPGGTN